MKSIKFNAAYGNETKEVKLAYIIGGYFHIMIDKFYYGRILQVNGKWVVKPQHSEYFSMDDIDAIIEMVEQNPKD